MNKDDAEILVNSVGYVYSPPQNISEGDRVKINIDLIKGRKNYDRMSSKYRGFVENSEGVIFLLMLKEKI